MLEADFYRNHVRKAFEQWGDHSRVENTAESGTPDITYAVGGIQGWVETKIIRSGCLKFEKFQLAWLRKRARHAHGKNLWVFATDGCSLYVFTADQILKGPRTIDRDWVSVNVAALGKPRVFGEKMPWPWGQVLVALSEQK